MFNSPLNETSFKMKRILLLFILIPAFAFSQQKNVMIRVLQDQSFLLGDFQTNLTLKKSAFKFQIMLENTEGVYVFASIKDSVYRFTETSPIRDFAYLPLLELRDGDEYNTNKESPVARQTPRASCRAWLGQIPTGFRLIC